MEKTFRRRKDGTLWMRNDKYGLLWQIIPRALGRLMGDNNADKAQSVTKAILQMDKIGTARLEQAYDQA